jgi:hypothetical protein
MLSLKLDPVTKELKEDHGFLRWPSGGVVQMSTYQATTKKLLETPEAMTDWDFEVIKGFEGADGLRRAREQHQKATEPPVMAAPEVVAAPPNQKVIREADLVVSTRGLRGYLNRGREKARPSAEERDATHYLSRLPASAETVLEAIAYGFRLAKELTDGLDARLKALESRTDAAAKPTHAGDGHAITEASVKSLAARLEALEARPAMIYRGLYDAGRAYSKGDCVTDRGSVWYCSAESISSVRPGDGSLAWVLAVKRGRDAKELR